MLDETQLPKQQPDKKRGPGRPKKDEHSVSFTITMPPANFDQLNEQVAATGRSRSELLRNAWGGVPLTLRHEPGLDEHYDQLGSLATTLNQLLELAQLGLAQPAQVQNTLSLVNQKMVELSGQP